MSMEDAKLQNLNVKPIFFASCNNKALPGAILIDHYCSKRLLLGNQEQTRDPTDPILDTASCHMTSAGQRVDHM